MLNIFLNKSRSAIIVITKTQKEDVSNMEFLEFSSYLNFLTQELFMAFDAAVTSYNTAIAHTHVRVHTGSCGQKQQHSAASPPDHPQRPAED